MEIPNSEKIYPSETCIKCGKALEVIGEAGDEEETIYIGCPDKIEEKDEHTEYNGQPKSLLEDWGWGL